MIAKHIVQAMWPEVKLYEVDCHIPKGIIQSRSNPLELFQRRAVWRVPQGTALITSDGWGM